MANQMKSVRSLFSIHQIRLYARLSSRFYNCASNNDVSTTSFRDSLTNCSLCHKTRFLFQKRDLSKLGFKIHRMLTPTFSREYATDRDKIDTSDPHLHEILQEINADFANENSELTDNSDGELSNQKGECEYENRESEDIAVYSYQYDDLSDSEDIPFAEIMEEEEFPIRLERGTTGVFDIEELVCLLENENGCDICVIKIQEEINYVDHMVIVTGRSARHTLAMAEITKWAFKRKRGHGDPHSVNIEGQRTDHKWLALDLGNIVLHIFLEEIREKYDLETLWTVGEKYDEKSKKLDDRYTANSFEELFGDSMILEEDDGNNVNLDIEVRTEHENITKSIIKDEIVGMESLAGWHSASAKDH